MALTKERPSRAAGVAAAARIIEPGEIRRRRRPRWLPRTLDRYVARTFLTSYLVCTLAFVGIYVMVEALTKLERFLKEDPFWLTLLQYHAAMVPTIFVNHLGPVLTTAAAVATAAALHRANELSPLKASGVPVHRTLAPVYALALLIAAGHYYLQEAAIPQLRGPIRRAISLTKNGAIRLGSPFFDQAGNQLISVREYSPAAQLGRGVEVSRYYPSGEIREKIDAQEIVWQPDPAAAVEGDRGRWVLHNGSIQRWNEARELVENPGASSFARLKEPFARRDLEGGLLPIDLESSDQDIAYLSFNELKKQLFRQPYHRHLEVKLHHHLAFPLAHLFLPAIAIPLVLASGVRSVLLSVAASVAIGAAYYLVSTLAMSAAMHSDRFAPLIAAWLPVLLFGSLGVTLTAQMRT